MRIHFYILLLAFNISCQDSPKVIKPAQEEGAKNTGQSTGIFSDDQKGSVKTQSSSTSNVHTVTILESIPTSKYVYLKVQEGQEEFWIATGKKEVNIGETYFYKNGILKTNFESKEHNRIFEKIYLVSNIVPTNHSGASANNKVNPAPVKSSVSSNVGSDVEGSTKIRDLVENPDKWSGKDIQVSGMCTKVNPNIMGRNWIHLKDGSMDEYDLVITSAAAIPEGHVVTMIGQVVLNKDFGAGYMYEILIENGQIVKSK